MSNHITITAENIGGDVALLDDEGQLVVALTPADAWTLAGEVIKAAMVAAGESIPTGYVMVKL